MGDEDSRDGRRRGGEMEKEEGRQIKTLAKGEWGEREKGRERESH